MKLTSNMVYVNKNRGEFYIIKKGFEKSYAMINISKTMTETFTIGKLKHGMSMKMFLI